MNNDDERGGASASDANDFLETENSNSSLLKKFWLAEPQHKYSGVLMPKNISYLSANTARGQAGFMERIFPRMTPVFNSEIFTPEYRSKLESLVLLQDVVNLKNINHPSVNDELPYFNLETISKKLKLEVDDVIKMAGKGEICLHVKADKNIDYYEFDGLTGNQYLLKNPPALLQVSVENINEIVVSGYTHESCFYGGYIIKFDGLGGYEVRELKKISGDYRDIFWTSGGMNNRVAIRFEISSLIIFKNELLKLIGVETKGEHVLTELANERRNKLAAIASEFEASHTEELSRIELAKAMLKDSVYKARLERAFKDDKKFKPSVNSIKDLFDDMKYMTTKLKNAQIKNAQIKNDSEQG